MPHRRRLRSASTEQLDVPTCRRSTIGRRAFPVTGAKVWNGLPSEIMSASLLSVFKNMLKTYLFSRCYETVWLWITFLFPGRYLPSRIVVLAIVLCCLGHPKNVYDDDDDDVFVWSCVQIRSATDRGQGWIWVRARWGTHSEFAKTVRFLTAAQMFFIYYNLSHSSRNVSTVIFLFFPFSFFAF